MIQFDWPRHHFENSTFSKVFYLEENNLNVIATNLDHRYKHNLFTPVTEEKIKEDILKMRNTEGEVSGSHNSERANRMRMRDSSEKDTEQPGTIILFYFCTHTIFLKKKS